MFGFCFGGLGVGLKCRCRKYSRSSRRTINPYMLFVVRQPGFEASQTVLCLLVQFLGGLGGQAPAILLTTG